MQKKFEAVQDFSFEERRQQSPPRSASLAEPWFGTSDPFAQKVKCGYARSNATALEEIEPAAAIVSGREEQEGKK